MYPEKTKLVIEWLEITQPNRQFSLQNMKELLSIALAELADQNDKTFDALPGNIIEVITESMKTSGEYYYLDEKIEKFKMSFKEPPEK
jgi:hypothetical protein